MAFRVLSVPLNRFRIFKFLTYAVGSQTIQQMFGDNDMHLYYECERLDKEVSSYFCSQTYYKDVTCPAEESSNALCKTSKKLLYYFFSLLLGHSFDTTTEVEILHICENVDPEKTFPAEPFENIEVVKGAEQESSLEKSGNELRKILKKTFLIFIVLRHFDK